MSKALAKFWPSSWLVPICSALPSPIMASHVRVLMAPGEPLAGGLAADDDRHGQHVGHEGGVDLAVHPLGVGPGVLEGGVRRVALLPEELGGAQPDAGPQLPAHHVGPLVEQQGQIAVALHPLGHVLADDGLAGGAHHDRLVELLAAGHGDHGQLGTEALDVIGLALQVALGDEQREVGVLGADVLDAAIDVGLHALPDGVAVRADDHGAPHRAVVGQLGLGLDVLVPAGEVLRLGGEYGWLGHRAAIVLPPAPPPRRDCGPWRAVGTGPKGVAARQRGRGVDRRRLRRIGAVSTSTAMRSAGLRSSRQRVSATRGVGPRVWRVRLPAIEWLVGKSTRSGADQASGRSARSSPTPPSRSATEPASRRRGPRRAGAPPGRRAAGRAAGRAR